MKRISLLILLTVCACAHADNIWVNPNLAQHDFKQERFQCLQIAAASTPPATATAYDPVFGVQSYDVNASNRETLFKACMEAKDWHMETVMVQPGQTVRAE
jgi:hypothetical protein